MQIDTIDFLNNLAYAKYGNNLKNLSKIELYSVIVDYIKTKIYSVKEKQSSLNSHILCSFSFEYLPGKLTSLYLDRLYLFNDLSTKLRGIGIDLSKLIDLEREPSLGAGSLASVCTDFIQETTNMHINHISYGIRYKSGRFKQLLIDGNQIEQADNFLIKNYWENSHEKLYKIKFPFGEVGARYVDIPAVSEDGEFINIVRLFYSVPVVPISVSDFMNGQYYNAYSSTIKALQISEFLYPSEMTPQGRNLRILQEYFLASASIQNILDENKSIEDIIFQINDGSSWMVILVLIYELENRGYSFDDILTLLKPRTIFMNFSANIESFQNRNVNLLSEVAPHLSNIYNKLKERYLKDLDIKINSEISAPEIIMPCVGSVLGLSNLHKNFLKLKKNNFYKYILNLDTYFKIGISSSRWKTKDNKFDDCISKKIKVFDIKLPLKREFSKYIYQKMGIMVNPYSIFDVQLQGIRETKRQLLNALFIAKKYFSLLENPHQYIPDVTYIFSGKAAFDYLAAKETISFINELAKCINNDLRIKNKIKIIFIEDLNISLKKKILACADINENLGFSIYESGGTTLLQSAANAVINISSKTGIAMDFKQFTDDGIVFFGDDINTTIDKMNDNKRDGRNIYYDNKEIKDLVDKLISLPPNIFNYDFSKLYDLIIDYNDAYFILDDLSDYYKQKINLEKSYFNRELWEDKAIKSYKASKNFLLKDVIKDYISTCWNLNYEKKI